MESSEVARCLGANRGRRWGPPSSRCELSIITCSQVQSSPHFRCLLCLPSRDKKSPVLGAVPGALHSPYIEFQPFLPFVVHLYLFFFSTCTLIQKDIQYCQFLTIGNSIPEMAFLFLGIPHCWLRNPFSQVGYHSTVSFPPSKILFLLSVLLTSLILWFSVLKTTNKGHPCYCGFSGVSEGAQLIVSIKINILSQALLQHISLKIFKI